MRGFLAIIFSAAAMALWCSGCSQVNEGPARVRGKVTYQGSALHNGMIVFAPDPNRGAKGAMGRAEIQADGTYTLQSTDSSALAAGWYRVTVMAVENSPEGLDGQSYSIPRSLLPERYGDPEYSGLVCEIKSARVNTIDFNLE